MASKSFQARPLDPLEELRFRGVRAVGFMDSSGRAAWNWPPLARLSEFSVPISRQTGISRSQKICVTFYATASYL
ncbi:MAG: hypothetical protein AAF720_12810 [Pseudomonadota bacterium]